MNNKDLTCAEICEEETTKQLKELQRHNDITKGHSSYNKDEIFRFADDDFYYYRRKVEVREKRVPDLLYNIFFRLLEKYNIQFFPRGENNTYFEFIIEKEGKRYGILFDMFFDYEDKAAIIKNHNITNVLIVRTLRGKYKNWIENQNNCEEYQKNNIKEITVKEFFSEFFCDEDYKQFEESMDRFVSDVKELMGCKTIKFISSMNLAAQREFEEEILSNWDYENSKYQIIDKNNRKIKDYLNVQNISFKKEFFESINTFLSNDLYKVMTGTEDYAESFITSEWLYYSLKDKKNFDYTAIISGYLKSIEQLTKKLAYLYINKGYYINADKSAVANHFKNTGERIDLYYYDKDYGFVLCSDKRKLPQYVFVEFKETKKKFFSSSIGVFEHFFRYNTSVICNHRIRESICNIIACFTAECRNGYFHTHNLHNSDIVEKTRSNAILLYAILLGSIKEVLIHKDQLGIIKPDKFNEVCKWIRDKHRRGSNYFIFKYDDGSELKMFYDYKNNVSQYSDDGVEHYASLVFFKVDEFSLRIAENLNKDKNFYEKLYLKRENLPSLIAAVKQGQKNKILDIASL